MTTTTTTMMVRRTATAMATAIASASCAAFAASTRRSSLHASRAALALHAAPFSTTTTTTTTTTTSPAWSKALRLYPVTAQRSVPAAIPHPPYALPSFRSDPRMSQHASTGIEIKDAASQAAMRRAGKAAGYIRWFAGQCVAVGRTTDEIDRMVHNECVRIGVYPSPLRYAGFPKSLCSSINQVVCHGIPDQRPLEEGDIINLDVSVYVDGHHGDCSGMYLVGNNVDDAGRRLVATVKRALADATRVCGPGVPFSRIGDVCHALADAHGYSVVRTFCGHGIGRLFHMPPYVWHHRNNDPHVMQTGMTFTIEPMFNEGTHDVGVLQDDWTIVTLDGRRSAQVEDTLLITETGVESLTHYDPMDAADRSVIDSLVAAHTVRQKQHDQQRKQQQE